MDCSRYDGDGFLRDEFEPIDRDIVDKLSDSLYLCIFKNLSPRDLCSLAETCKKIKKIVESSVLWEWRYKRLAKEVLGTEVTTSSSVHVNYKQLYCNFRNSIRPFSNVNKSFINNEKNINKSFINNEKNINKSFINNGKNEELRNKLSNVIDTTRDYSYFENNQSKDFIVTTTFNEDEIEGQYLGKLGESILIENDRLLINVSNNNVKHEYEKENMIELNLEPTLNLSSTNDSKVLLSNSVERTQLIEEMLKDNHFNSSFIVSQKSMNSTSLFQDDLYDNDKVVKLKKKSDGKRLKGIIFDDKITKKTL